MKATEPAAALYALAALLVLLIVAPVAAHAAELHDELRWTEGLHIVQPPAKPIDTQKKPPAAKPRPRPIEVASAQRVMRRR